MSLIEIINGRLRSHCWPNTIPQIQFIESKSATERDQICIYDIPVTDLRATDDVDSWWRRYLANQMESE